MTKDMITVFNMETEEEISREMTKEESDFLAEAKNKAAADALALEQKAESRLALLERLGLTAEEAALLLA
jgi:hypothetical protein